MLFYRQIFYKDIKASEHYVSCVSSNFVTGLFCVKPRTKHMAL